MVTPAQGCSATDRTHPNGSCASSWGLKSWIHLRNSPGVWTVLGFLNLKSWSRKNPIVVTAILGKKGLMTFLYEKDFIGSILASMNLPKLTNRMFFHLKIPFARNP